jgi:hypothetical protein
MCAARALCAFRVGDRGVGFSPSIASEMSMADDSALKEAEELRPCSGIPGPAEAQSRRDLPAGVVHQFDRVASAGRPLDRRLMI